MIKSWSYSKLLDYEQCPYRVKLKYLDKVPQGPAPAAERGTMIHGYAEDYVMGKLNKLPGELAKFSNEFEVLRTEYKAKHVSLEGEWGFDRDWMPTDYKGAWLRMKGDAILFQGTSAVVIDYKTGASYGNELKHGEQCLLYAIATFVRQPKVESIKTELWYLDKDELMQREYTRPQALRFVQPFTKRAEALCHEKDFHPNANIFTCKWCPFGPAKGGQCEYGVDASVNPMQDYRRKYG